MGYAGENVYAATVWGNVTKATPHQDQYIIGLYDAGIPILHPVWYNNQRMADETRSKNVALPIALYLGSSAQV